MTVNPFEPPRSDDGPVAQAAGAGADHLPDEALQALVATAPWARWSVRLSLVSALLTAVHSLITLGKATRTGEVVTSALGFGVGVLFAILWVAVTGRYASHAERLQFREHRALAGTIAAQRSIFRLMGITVFVSIGLAVLGAVVGAAIGSSQGPRHQ